MDAHYPGHIERETGQRSIRFHIEPARPGLSARVLWLPGLLLEAGHNASGPVASSSIVCEQELSAPNLTIISIPRPIESHTEGRFFAVEAFSTMQGSNVSMIGAERQPKGYSHAGIARGRNRGNAR